MGRILFETSMTRTIDEPIIKSRQIPLTDVKVFLDSINNNSFDSITVQHYKYEEQDYLYINKQEGIREPYFKVFINAIELSDYYYLFKWDY